MQLRPSALLTMTCALFAAIALAGCKKIENPMPHDLRRSGFLFNYTIENPEAKKRTRSVSVAKRFDHGHLTVLVRGDFLPDGVLESYQEKSGVEIKVSRYFAHEEMRKRVEAGEQCDLVFASGFMVKMLSQEGHLADLNYANIPNIRHVAPHFRSLPFDADNKRSVALVWHTVGIAYNTRILDHTPHRWSDLFEPSPTTLAATRGRIGLIASPYRIFAAALLQQGFASGSSNPSEMDAAAAYLRRVGQQGHFALVPETEMATRLAKEEVVLGMAHSSDVTRALKSNPNLSFVLPIDGTWVSFDNVVVLHKTTPERKEIAEDFINFLLHPTVAAELANNSLEASTEPAAAPYLAPNIKFGPSAVHPREGWTALMADANSSVQTAVYQDLVAAQAARGK